MANGSYAGLEGAEDLDRFGGSGGSGSMSDTQISDDQQSASGEEDTAPGGETIPFTEPITLTEEQIVTTVFPDPDSEAQDDLAPTDGDTATGGEMPARTSSEDRPTEGGPLQMIEDNPLAAAAVGAGALLLLMN